MKKLCFILSFLTYCFFGDSPAQESLNMTSLYNYDLTEDFNDCWGYVDAAGNEYAIVGTLTKILFFNVTDPNNVTLVKQFSNGNPTGLSMGSSIWRDFKTYGTKAYACADQGTEGLLVFDLSGLPDTVILEDQYTSFFARSHNIFVDTTSGYLYTAGANSISNGTRILDLNNDPITVVATESFSPGGYIHDIYVHNDTAYCSHGNNGYYIWDFGDPQNPELLAGVSTGGYNHSSWPTEDRSYAIYAEEVPIGQPLRVVDLSELEFGNIEVVLSFKYPLLAPTHVNNRPHNPFIKGDLLYVAYYHDGVQIFDISDPLNPTVAGYYDTYPENTIYTSYYGAWGVYPYLPSGNIIASDIDNGFFLLEYSVEPLPVELTLFSAIAEKDKVKLEWTTASEENSRLFEVQKSADGVDFETFARVDAAGNSNAKIDYRAYDEKPFIGDNYYRLKQVDLDGKFEYSDIEVVRFSSSPVEIFPTLVTFDEPLKIAFFENTQDLQMQLFSIQGQLLMTMALSGVTGQQEEIRLDDLQNGTYIIQAFDGNHQVSKRIVIAR